MAAAGEVSSGTRVQCAASAPPLSSSSCWSAAPRAWAQPPSCSGAGQNLFVRDTLQELYLWYRELPAVDPARFDSPEAYLEAVRYRPLDTSFSYITSRAANDAFYSDSQYIGLGLSTSLSGSEMRVLQVFADSPAAEAGLARGARIDAASTACRWRR